MNRAVPDCLVTGYEELVAGLTLPDPDDRHVFAAAIRVGAQAIVTFNVSDFPDHRLAPLGIEATHPDDFVLEVLHLAPEAACGAVRAQADALRAPPMSLRDLLDKLREQVCLSPSAGSASFLVKNSRAENLSNHQMLIR